MPDVKPVSTIEDDSVGFDDYAKVAFLNLDDGRSGIMNITNSFSSIPITETQLEQVLKETYFFDKSRSFGNKDDYNRNKNYKKKKRKVNNKKARIEVEKNLDGCIGKNSEIESDIKKGQQENRGEKTICSENKIGSFKDEEMGKKEDEEEGKEIEMEMEMRMEMKMETEMEMEIEIEKNEEDKEMTRRKDEEKDNEEEKERGKNQERNQEKEQENDQENENKDEKEKEKERKQDKDEEKNVRKNDILNDVAGSQTNPNDQEIEDDCYCDDETIKKMEGVDEIDSSKETIEVSSQNICKITTNGDESEENGTRLNEMVYNEIKRLELENEGNKRQQIYEGNLRRGEKKKTEVHYKDSINKDGIVGPAKFKLKKPKKARKHRKKKKLRYSIEPIREQTEEPKIWNNESKSIRSLPPSKFKDNASILIKNDEESTQVNENIIDEIAIETVKSNYAIDVCDQITFNSPIKDLEINSGEDFEIDDNKKCNQNCCERYDEKCNEKFGEKNEVNSINNENVEDNEVYEPFSYNSSHLDDESRNSKEKSKKKRKRSGWLHNWFRKIDTPKVEDFELKEVLIEEENSRLGTGSYMLQQIRENLKQMFLFEKRQALTEEKLKSLEDSIKRNKMEGPKVEEKDCIMMMGEKNGTIIKKVIEGRVLIIENQPLMDKLKTQGKRADRELKSELVKYIKMGDIFIFDNVEGKKYITIDISNLKS